MTESALTDARALLDVYPAIDLHADTLMWSRWISYDLLARHTPPLPRAALGGHVDVPRMRTGGMGAQFFGLVSLPWFGQSRGMARTVHEQIDALDETLRAQSEESLKQGKAPLPELVVSATPTACAQCAPGHRRSPRTGRRSGHGSKTFAQAGRSLPRPLAHFSANEACRPAYGRGRR